MPKLFARVFDPEQGKFHQGLSDATASEMVTRSIYLKGEPIDGKKNRWVVVLAVPYGELEGVTTIEEAVGAFRDLLADDDWKERTVQVFDAATGEIEDYCPEDRELTYEEDETDA
jgi:hypothetical protein